MEPLYKLNNVQKAALFFQLVPIDLADFISYMKELADFTKANPEQVKKDWKFPLFSPELWIKLAINASGVIEKYGVKLTKNRRFFTDQLFNDLNALFAVHCLQQFVLTEELKDPKFKIAVDLFFSLPPVKTKVKA